MKAKERKPGLIGSKVGMTQVFDENGEARGATVVQVGPCTVTQIKQDSKEGYEAIQLGFGATEFRRLSKPLKGHFEKKSLKPFRHLKEFRVNSTGAFQLGQEIDVSVFEVGDRVDVTGISKGKGFQGVIKRHHKGGGPASHGSHFHRSTGSIGQRTWPGRVFKLMKLPGHMGDRQVTVRNLKVLQVIPEKNFLVLEGAVPGGVNAMLSIKHPKADVFQQRLTSRSADQQETPQENEPAAEGAS